MALKYEPDTEHAVQYFVDCIDAKTNANIFKALTPGLYVVSFTVGDFARWVLACAAHKGKIKQPTTEIRIWVADGDAWKPLQLHKCFEANIDKTLFATKHFDGKWITLFHWVTAKV